MIIFILIILILMNGVGYFNPTPGNYRYGLGGLGIIVLIVLLLFIFGILPAGHFGVLTASH